MNKRLLLTLCIICTTFFAHAQTVKDVADSESMTWYGIDYSETRFMNFGPYINEDIIKRSLPRWSFDPFGGDDIDRWKKKYKKDNLEVDIAKSGERNKNTEYAAHIGNDAFELTKDDLQEMVSAYDISGDGYGMLFVGESFDKSGTKEARMWVVLINKKDASIIDAEKFTIETYGDWSEGIRLGVKQSARYMNKAK